jgi:tetratricopeptide (TPR) repeat protein
MDKALPLFVQVYERQRERLGANHPETLASMTSLALVYLRTGKVDRSEALLRECLQLRRKKEGPESLAIATTLAVLGANLLVQKRNAEAEPFLREALTIREKKGPDNWSTFHTKSLLGAALLGQGRYTEAEPLLCEGYEGLRRRQAKIPPQNRPSLTQALQLLVKLYTRSDKKDLAAMWQKKLQAHQEAEKKRDKPKDR